MKQTKTKYLLQEGLINHLNGNKGKYIAGASLAGLGAYGAQNGNLGSAINAGIDNGAAMVGIGMSNMQNPDYSSGIKAGRDYVNKVYNAEEDPNIEFAPKESYDLGQGAGNVAGYFGESEDIDINADDDDESGLSVAAKTIGVSGATIAGGLHLANNGEKYVKKAKDTKDQAIKKTRNSASKLLVDVAKKVRAKKGK